MSEYGYLPDSANIEQSFGNNKGIFSPKDIYDLTRADKYTNYGQLELIETVSISGTPSAFSFDNLQTDKYDTHFITVNNYKPQTDNRHLLIQFKVGGTVDSATNYRYAMLRMTGATQAYLRSDNDSKIWLAYNCGNATGESLNGYFYIYNAGNSNSFTGLSSQFMMIDKDTNQSMNFTTAVHDQLQQVNGFQFSTSGGNLEHGTFSLYGIRYS